MAGLTSLSGVLPPDATIGIIGGGQLGRMLASSAARLGFRTIVLEPGVDCPARQVCNDQIEAHYNDNAALQELARRCNVVTYEFENVPLSTAHFLECTVPLYPPSKALEVSQDRLTEKTFLQNHGIEVAAFHPVKTSLELASALAEFNGGVLKTRRFGYDGKGQHVFHNNDDGRLDDILTGLGAGPFVLEQKIVFQSEFSIIAARGLNGCVGVYDPAINTHRDGILYKTKVPARLGLKLAEEARQIVTTLLNALEYVGVIGVEFFETTNGLVVNEFAPRVHNSGHWTREACSVSQFEQHIRAITGLPLGSVKRYHDCEMINLLGDDGLSIAEKIDDENTHVTLYGKHEARKGRKMGHITRLFPLT